MATKKASTCILTIKCVPLWKRNNYFGRALFLNWPFELSENLAKIVYAQRLWELVQNIWTAKVETCFSGETQALWQLQRLDAGNFCCLFDQNGEVGRRPASFLPWHRMTKQQTIAISWKAIQHSFVQLQLRDTSLTSLLICSARRGRFLWVLLCYALN